MKRKAVVSMLLSGLLAASLVGAAAPASAGKKASGPVVVGTDEAGDWGSNSAAGSDIAPIGDTLGQDLTGASIAMNGTDKVDFIMSVNNLPASGGVPEISRYTWDMDVDGEFLELDGKFSNYSRGVCDPTSGQCQAGPRDPGMQPFFVRGNCAANEANVTICEELGIVKGVFDSAKKTITVTVPLDLLGAKSGSKITPGTNIFGGSISATPAAFVTSNYMPLDTLTVTKTFVVSSGKK